MQKNVTHKNIKIDYLFRFIMAFNLTGAIWVLYLGYKGMSLLQVGLLEGFFHVISMLFEIPTGAAADLLGRKKTLLLGRLAAIISGVLMLTSRGFFGFLIAFIFSALSYNLNSGSEEALIYDSLKEYGEEEKFLKVNSRLNFIQEISGGLAQFMGGVLAQTSYLYAYGLDMIINLAAFLSGGFFREPTREEKERKHEKGLIRIHFLTCYHLLKENNSIRRILLFYPFILAFAATCFFYGQQHFSNMGLNKIQIAIIILFSGLFASFGALSADRLSNFLKGKSKYVAASGAGIFIALFGSHNVWVMIGAFFLQSYFSAVLFPISSNSLNELIPSNQRATIISLDSMMYSLTMIVVFPICGFLGDVFGLSKIFVMLGVVIMLFQVWFYISERTRKIRKPH